MTSLQHICDQLVRWLLGQSPPANPHWSAGDWQAALHASRVHGISILLHETLGGEAWLPVEVRRWLAQQSGFNARRIQRMQAELAQVLALFAAYSLPVIPLKGSILTGRFYATPGQRPMADLDLLVRADDFERAAALLAHLDYRRLVTHWKHTEFCRPLNRQVVSPQFEHPDNPRKLELHGHCRETFGGPTIDLTPLMWHNAGPGTLLGQPALLPSPDMLWLHLLVHATYHIWQGRGRLIQLIDLLRLAPHLVDPLPLLNAIDARYTFPALALLHRYFPNSVQPLWFEQQRKRVPARFQQWVNTLNLVNMSRLNPTPPGLYLFRALRFAAGHPQEIGQALRFALLPDPKEISLDHPRLAQSPAPWLAYFLLPLDWVKRLR